jgi:hypothetical protein
MFSSPWAFGFCAPLRPFFPGKDREAGRTPG